MTSVLFMESFLENAFCSWTWFMIGNILSTMCISGGSDNTHNLGFVYNKNRTASNDSEEIQSR